MSIVPRCIMRWMSEEDQEDPSEGIGSGFIQPWDTQTELILLLHKSCMAVWRNGIASDYDSVRHQEIAGSTPVSVIFFFLRNLSFCHSFAVQEQRQNNAIENPLFRLACVA